jgi:chemotaxis protein CheD
MGDIVVGISELKVSNNQEDILVTFALGSCIGISVFDPQAKVGGLLHFMLPDSFLDTRKAKDCPAMFADTGIPVLFKTCYAYGAEKKRMIVKVAGGASILDDTNYFRIGQKNITAVRKIFWRNNILIDGEDTGKNINRTVRLNLSDGNCVIKSSDGVVRSL